MNFDPILNAILDAEEAHKPFEPPSTTAEQAVITRQVTTIAELQQQLADAIDDRNQSDRDAQINHDRCVTLTDEKAALEATHLANLQAVDVKRLRLLDDVRDLIIEDGPDAFPDGFVDALVDMGMDPLEHEVEVTFVVKTRLTVTISGVPYDEDADDVARAISRLYCDSAFTIDDDDLQGIINRGLDYDDCDADVKDNADISWTCEA